MTFPSLGIRRGKSQATVLSGAENFFESQDEQLQGSNRRIRPIALVNFLEKLKNRCLVENLLSIRVSGLFCTTKGNCMNPVIQIEAELLTLLGFMTETKESVRRLCDPTLDSYLIFSKVQNIVSSLNTEKDIWKSAIAVYTATPAGRYPNSSSLTMILPTLSSRVSL